MSPGGDRPSNPQPKSTPPVPIFTEDSDPVSDETPVNNSVRPQKEQAAERVLAEALVELRNEFHATYTTLATGLTDVQRGLRSHIQTSKLQHAASLSAMQNLGNGIMELNATLLAKEEIDKQRLGAWKAELDAVATQAGKNALELANEDGAARMQLDSLHETVDLQQIQVQKAAKLANTAIQAAAIRLGVIAAVVIATYKIAAYCWTHGWITP